MPYIARISKALRTEMDPEIAVLLKKIETIIEEKKLDVYSLPGFYNYLFTSLLAPIKADEPRWRYWQVNMVQGILGCVGSEFYRRLGSPMEDMAKAANGDLPIYEDSDASWKNVHA